MKCEYDPCIYNQNSKCLVKDIGINATGMCDACMLVSLPRGEIEKRKREQREEIERRWREEEVASE